MALGILVPVSFMSCPKDKFFPKHRGGTFFWKIHFRTLPEEPG